jgi:hypothetical protein
MRSLLNEKNPEVDRVGVHGPSIHRFHGAGDLLEVVVYVEVFRIGESGKPNAEVLPQLLVQRQVGVDLLVREREGEARPCIGPGQLGRDQDQGCPPRALARVGLVPVEHAQSEIEDIDALFFEGRMGETKRVPEADVQLRPVVRRLEPVVGVTIGSPVRFVFRRHEG